MEDKEDKEELMNKEELITLPMPQGTSHCGCLEHCFLFVPQLGFSKHYNFTAFNYKIGQGELVALSRWILTPDPLEEQTLPQNLVTEPTTVRAAVTDKTTLISQSESNIAAQSTTKHQDSSTRLLANPQALLPSRATPRDIT